MRWFPISSHFHLSPMVPGFYSDGEIEDTVRAIAGSGGQCIYSNILGMRYRNTRVFFESMEKINPQAVVRIRSDYRKNGDSPKNICSPGVDLIYGEMAMLRDCCRRTGIDFICEFMPGLDEFVPTRFEQGIFRFGLPAVYQMIPIFENGSGSIGWCNFREIISKRYPAMDDDYLALLKSYWDDGQLFDNTRIGCEIREGERFFFKTPQLNFSTGAALSWD